MRKPIDQMAEAFLQRLTELFQWSNDEEIDHPPTAVEIEDKIREWIRQIGEDTQSLVLGGMDRYRREGKQCCPRCEEAVYWERYEPRNWQGSTFAQAGALAARGTMSGMLRLWCVSE